MSTAFIKSFISISVFIILFQSINPEVLKKDPVMIKYKVVQAELSDGIVTKKYKLPANYADLQKSIMANPSKENMIAILKNAGMTNADEYVEKMALQTSLMFEFLRKHPELSKMDSKAKAELFRKLLER